MLEQEGVENAEELLKDQTKAEQIADRIKENYKAKKEAVIARMREKLNEIAPIDEGQSPDTRISKVADELSKKRESFSQLIHFSNIMSSFFEVSKQGVNIAGDDQGNNGGAKAATNSAVAQRELENLGKDFESSKEQLRQNIGEGGNTNGGSSSDSDSSGEVTLGIATINNILLPETRSDPSTSKND